MGTFRYALRDAFRLLGRHWGLALLIAVAVFFLVELEKRLLRKVA